jgi:hypothetical protein
VDYDRLNEAKRIPRIQAMIKELPGEMASLWDRVDRVRLLSVSYVEESRGSKWWGTRVESTISPVGAAKKEIRNRCRIVTRKESLEMAHLVSK